MTTLRGVVPMRITLKTLAALTAVVLLIPTESVLAQRRRGLADVTPPERHGFWLSAGAGAGWESYKFAVPGNWAPDRRGHLARRHSEPPAPAGRRAQRVGVRELR